MSNIKGIKALILLENLQGLFRRDVFNRKYMKYIISSIWPVLILTLIFQDSNLNLRGECLEIQNIIVNLKTFCIILCSTFNSDKYIRMIKIMNNFHRLIKREAYSRMTKKLNIVVTTCVSFIFVLGLCIESIFWVTMPDQMLECHIREVVFLLALQLYWADSFAFMGALLYYCLCSVIAYQLESLSELIRSDMRSLSNIAEKCTLPKLYWRRWGDNYINICDCVELLNVVFGLQTTLVLTISGMYFVYLFQIYVGTKDFITLFMVFLPEFMAIAFISKAGQVIKKKAIDLERTLVRVEKKIVEEEQEESFNAISSIISLTSGRPIHTQIFGNIDTGYAMLPTVFMYVTTPLIIVLQFKM